MKNQNSAIDLLDFSIIKFYFLEFKPLIKIHLCIKFDDDDDDDDDDYDDDVLGFFHSLLSPGIL